MKRSAGWWVGRIVLFVLGSAAMLLFFAIYWPHDVGVLSLPKPVGRFAAFGLALLAGLLSARYGGRYWEAFISSV